MPSIPGMVMSRNKISTSMDLSRKNKPNRTHQDKKGEGEGGGECEGEGKVEIKGGVRVRVRACKARGGGSRKGTDGPICHALDQLPSVCAVLSFVT